jgi:hypothetical protein
MFAKPEKMNLKRNFVLFLLSAMLSYSNAANYYWVPDYTVYNFNWSDLNNWATTSGGIVHPAMLPGPADNVIVDAGSIVPQLNIDDTAKCFHIAFASGLPNPLVLDLGYPLMVFGSFNGCSNLNINVRVEFWSNVPGNTIDLYAPAAVMGGTINGLRAVFKGSGEWSLLSPLEANYIGMEGGTIKTNNYRITTHNFMSTGNANRSMLLGQSTVETIDQGGGFFVSGSNYFIDADSAVIKLTVGDNIALAFDGGNSQHYHIVEFDTIAPTPGISGTNCEIDELICFATLQNMSFSGRIHKAQFYAGGFLSNASTGALVYDTLILENTLPPSFGSNSDYYLDTDSLFVNNVFQVNSGISDTISITESLGGFGNYLTLPADTMCLDFLKLRNINARGTGFYFTGNNSVDLGFNSGWFFYSCNFSGVGTALLPEKDNIKIYPNPTCNSVVIESPEEINVIRIYSLTGQLLRTEYVKNSKNNFIMRLDDLTDGLYFIELESNKEIMRKTVIRQ